MYLQRNVTIAIQLLMLERPAEHMMRQNLAKEISTRLIFRMKKVAKYGAVCVTQLVDSHSINSVSLENPLGLSAAELQRETVMHTVEGAPQKHL